MSSQKMGAVDVYLEPETIKEIEQQLEYGDTKSGWAREAIRMRLDALNDDGDTTEE